MKSIVIKYVVLLAFMISGCSVDLKTKDLIKDNLYQQSVVVIDNVLSLNYVENHAIAFGTFKNLNRNLRMTLSFGLPVLATLLAFFFIWKIRKNEFRFLLPIFIILGGAMGNILDRMMNGFVTDFLHINHFAYVFNFADVLVNIGLGLILIQYKSFNKMMDQAFAKNTLMSQ